MLIMSIVSLHTEIQRFKIQGIFSSTDLTSDLTSIFDGVEF